MPAGPELDAYFDRIGYGDAATPTLETLRALQLRHVAAIAFENLDPLTGRTPALDEASLTAKLVRARRGGYCYEQNGLFKLVLERLGFRVRGLAARVLWNAPEQRITPRSHMLLLVDVGGEVYAVDVGFGVITPTAPLRLEPDSVQQTPHERYRLLSDGEQFTLQTSIRSEWKPLYRFDLQEQAPSDYEVSNWYVATHPSSIFVNRLIAARAIAGRRYTLSDSELSTHDVASGRTEKQTLASCAELEDTLGDVFGIDVSMVPGAEGALARAIARTGAS